MLLLLLLLLLGAPDVGEALEEGAAAPVGLEKPVTPDAKGPGGAEADAP